MKRGFIDFSKFKKTGREITPEALPQNDYYEEVSARLGIFQVVLYLSLLAFVVLSFFQNTNLITYRNFYHFFKDLNASAESVDLLAAESVTYPTSNTQSFALYRGGLAVAGNRSVSIFTAAGRQNVSTNINYQNPVAIGSGKYLLVYELGGKQYSLYNSHSQIYSGKTDHPINGASISDSGMYALVSSSEEYPSVVSLYNSRFALINRYHKSGYVMSTDVDAKGERIAILISNAEAGSFKTSLELYRPGATEAEGVVEIGASLGLTCRFTASGKTAVLCSEGLYFVTPNGECSLACDIAGREISETSFDREGVALCLKPDTAAEKNRIIVFDKDGKMLYNEAEEETLCDLAYKGESIFFLSATAVHRIDLKSGEQASKDYHTEQKKILAIDGEELLVCSPQKAEYLHFGS